MDDRDGAAIREQLLDLEHRLLHPGASVDVGALLADGFLEVGASGRRWDRAEALALVEARRDTGVGEYDLFEVGCRALGGGAHLLTYAVRTDRGVTRRASIWDLVEARWRLIYHQGTRVPAGDHD